MPFRLCLIILMSLFIASCKLIPPGPYSATTPFVVSDNTVEKTGVTVGNHEPFFIHQIQYQDQVVLTEDYGNNSENIPILGKGTKLFSVEVWMENLPGESVNGRMSQTLFCGLISKQSMFNKFMTGAEGGDEIRCLRDANQDGNFETAYHAVGALEVPLTVYVVQRKILKMAKPVSYQKIMNGEKQNIGQVWFQVRSPLLRAKVVDHYIGGGKSKTMIGTYSLEKKTKGKALSFNFQGASIEVTSIEDGKVLLKLLKPIELDRKYGLVKTVTTTYMPIYY